MRKALLVITPLLAAALIAQSAPTPGLTGAVLPLRTMAAPPAPDSPADANLTAWVGEVQANPSRFDQYLEEICIEDGSQVCELTNQQIQLVPSEIEALTQDLGYEVQDDPGLVEASHHACSQGGLAKVIANVAKKGANFAARKLVDKADDIAKVADNAAGGLSEGTTLAVSKAIIYSVPVFGDMFALGEAAADGDVEEGVVLGSR